MQHSSKSEIRKSLRERRKKLSADDIRIASQKIAETVMQLPEFFSCKHIAYYLPHENEVDTALIAARAIELKKSLYLSIMTQKNKLDFYRVDANTQYIKNAAGILEPVVHHQLPASFDQLDFFLIPVVAFDRQCNRVGRGAGCYDRYLARAHKSILIGLAYAFQCVDQLVSEHWDVPMDVVVTEESIFRRIKK